jgi:hypothetical protein
MSRATAHRREAPQRENPRAAASRDAASFFMTARSRLRGHNTRPTVKTTRPRTKLGRRSSPQFFDNPLTRASSDQDLRSILSAASHHDASDKTTGTRTGPSAHDGAPRARLQFHIRVHRELP